MSGGLARIEQQEVKMTLPEMKEQVRVIAELMTHIMKKDVHYGTIPGTQKPTLYKPGSEKILSTFRIAAEPSDIADLSTDDEVRYRVKVAATAQATGVFLGAGIGECSSEEEKYKWRKPVCDEEFDETAIDRRRVVWKRGQGGKTYQQKQVRTHPSDVANTILKMAKKRAQIDMTLTVTAASDVFDQDLEDLSPEIREGLTENGKQGKPPVQPPQEKTGDEPIISQAQGKMLYALCSSKGMSKDIMNTNFQSWYKCELFKLPKSKFEEAKARIEALPNPGQEGKDGDLPL